MIEKNNTANHLLRSPETDHHLSLISSDEGRDQENQTHEQLMTTRGHETSQGIWRMTGMTSSDVLTDWHLTLLSCPFHAKTWVSLVYLSSLFSHWCWMSPGHNSTWDERDLGITSERKLHDKTCSSLPGDDHEKKERKNTKKHIIPSFSRFLLPVLFYSKSVDFLDWTLFTEDFLSTLHPVNFKSWHQKENESAYVFGINLRWTLE